MAVAVIAETPTPALPLDTVLHGDCLDVLRTLPDNSVDAIVTDPPAGISFMGKTWDSDKGGRAHWVAAFTAIYRECLRVLKPGGHALVWALPRTSHWTATALEDAGFEVRDRLAHVFGSGFPKSLDVSKAIDKAAKAKREVVGCYTRPDGSGLRASRQGWRAEYVNGDGGSLDGESKITAPATDAARTWDGWGTALKPAVEDWWLCRKPLAEGTVAANVLRWGTGALNIEASRVGVADDEPNKRRATGLEGGAVSLFGVGNHQRGATLTAGRWPANLLLSHSIWCSDGGCADDCPVAALDAQSGIRKTGKPTAGSAHTTRNAYGTFATRSTTGGGDTGGASRYFQTFRYQPKASRAERNRGCEGLPEVMNHSTSTHGNGQGSTRMANQRERAQGITAVEMKTAQNTHPTVKPLALMSWLITLITPPGGIVLDPFAGSGSTLVAAQTGGWRFIGIEREAEYVAIAQARLAAVKSLLKG